MSNLEKMSLTGKRNDASASKSDYSDVIMGIDLGTTNSAVAVYNAGMVPSLCSMNSQGRVTMPSCVKWEAPEMLGCKVWTVGEEAYNERYMPDVCYSVKRIMGSSKKVRFTDRFNSDRFIDMTPAEVSAIILQELKKRACESYPGLRRCIITVPAYFNQRQIEDTIEAAKIADLDCVQILKEPTSASYIYSQMGYAEDGSILVYDLGGGTFDVTQMAFLRKAAIPQKMYTSLKRQYGIDLSAEDDGVPFYCRVLGTYGDVNLGGDDIDHLLAQLVQEVQPDLNLTEREQEELELRCEQFKKSGLRGRDVIVNGKMCKLTTELLDKAVTMVFEKTMDIVRQIPADELDAVRTIVLVGGSTKSDTLVRLLGDAFPGKEISRVLDPDATVALGAGAVAKDVMEGRGATYQDVLPMMIGVLKDESIVDVVIPKNTPMPHSVNRLYHTIHDNQTAVSVDIYQGVSTNPAECTFLGRLRVTGLPPKPAGEVQINIYMMLSSTGRLTVTTVIDGVMEEHQLVIDSIYGVSEQEEHAEEQLALDEFEQSFTDLCAGDERLMRLLEKRRIAKSKGDAAVVSQLEAAIVEAL